MMKHINHYTEHKKNKWNADTNIADYFNIGTLFLQSKIKYYRETLYFNTGTLSLQYKIEYHRERCTMKWKQQIILNFLINMAAESKYSNSSFIQSANSI